MRILGRKKLKNKIKDKVKIPKSLKYSRHDIKKLFHSKKNPNIIVDNAIFE